MAVTVAGTSCLRLILPAALALLAALARPTFAEPPAEIDRPDVRDVELTLHARRVLHRDARLARYNLGVTVRGGEAVVWGSVPTRELASHALSLVGRVRGVYGVSNDMLVSGGHEEALESLLAGLARGGLLPDPAPWIEPQPPSAGPQEVINARPPVEVWDSSPASSESRPSPLVTLLRPVPVVRPEPVVARLPPPESPSAGADLDQRIEQLRSSDPRFRAVRCDITDGAVVLTGRVDQFGDAIEFGGAIARIPGVRSVDLRRVATIR